MFVIMICWISMLLVIKGPNVESSSPYCDPEDNMFLTEGNLGQTQTFPWLGVLRVHLHHETSLKIALTGIVLVKEGYAIANADDVARIPKRIFQDDSKAMFLPHDEAPWFCKVKDFMTHPEYEFETLNTIALLELDMTEIRVSPVRPICWPPYSYNVSDNLYAAGYTDENQMLEKMLYKLQYVEDSLCQEYYSRAGVSEICTRGMRQALMENETYLAEGKKVPTHLQCGFAVNNEANCVWDNGMALISNTTGYWILIGLSLHGPGCAAPARFIDLLTYYPWIESSTNLQGVDYGSPNYRKSAFGEGFKRPYRPRYGSSSASSEVENIPAHELLRSDAGGKVGGKQEFAHYYPYSTVLTTSPFTIDRIKSTEIEIHDRNSSGQFGKCDQRTNRLIYQDYIQIKAYLVSLKKMRQQGSARYMVHGATGASKAFLSYETRIEPTVIFAPDNPNEIIRHYPIFEQTFGGKRTRPPNWWQRGKPLTIQDKMPFGHDVPNINVYLKIDFMGEAVLDIKVFGEYTGKPTTTTPKPTTTKTTPNYTVNPYYAYRDNLRSGETKAYLRKDVTVQDEVGVSLGAKSNADLFCYVSIIVILYLGT